MKAVRVGKPTVLMDDGDLLTLVSNMVLKKGFGTIRITEVKGQADTEMVFLGQVGEDDRIW